MTEPTKACSLTENEVKVLIQHHGLYATSEPDKRIERMNYLNKRLKAFHEIEITKETTEQRPIAQDKPKGDGW